MISLSNLPRLVLRGAKIFLWCLSTTWLGFTTTVRAVRFAWRLRLIRRTSMTCSRGHTVELYFPYVCESCKAVSEGYVFDACPYCKSVPAWTPCTCGLAVANPVRW